MPAIDEERVRRENLAAGVKGALEAFRTTSNVPPLRAENSITENNSIANNQLHLSIQAALSVAKDLYAAESQHSEGDILHLIDDACHHFPPSETGMSKANLSLMVAGMLAFAGQVDRTTGAEALNALAHRAQVEARLRAVLSLRSIATLQAISQS